MEMTQAINGHHVVLPGGEAFIVSYYPDLDKDCASECLWIVPGTFTDEDDIAMTDNVATLQGFTREVIAESDQYTLCLLVRPETDFDDRFKAWDTDEQEFIRVNGWLFTIEEGEAR